MIYSVSTPNAYELKMAYNPILVNVLTTGVNPTVYVDIYMNGTYYKTIFSTSPDSNIFGFNLWQFDIRDAAQEYLRSQAPALSTSPTISQQVNAGIALCTVKARGSAVAGGYLVPDGPAPVQATMDNAAVSGVGVTAAGAPSWIIINGALQLEQDPVPATNLASNNLGYMAPGYQLLNMYNNPRLAVGKDDFMRLPVFIPTYGLTPGGGATVTSESYYLVIEDDAGTFYYPTNPGAPPTYATYMAYGNFNVYYLPAGPKNFAGLGVSFGVPPNWNTIKRYRMLLATGTLPTAGNTRWKSPFITVHKGCTDTRKRFQFVNWLGHFDTINFQEHEIELAVTAQGWEQYNLGYFAGTGKEAQAKQRYNVRSNEVVTATGYFREEEMFFVEQFLSNPTAYLEMKGTAGQPDYLQAVRLLDVTATVKKIDERYVYAITVKAENSNERINIRN